MTTVFLFFTVICFLTTLLLCLLNYLSHRALSRRLRQLFTLTKNFNSPESPFELPIKKDDALGIFVHALNDVLMRLRKNLLETQSEKAKLSAILDNMAEGVIGVDGNLRILITNPSARKILKLNPEYSGKNLLEIIRAPEMDAKMREAIESESTIKGDIEITFPEKKILRFNAVGVGSREAEICGILVFYDITKVRNLENMRREFVANVSHELRTPLTSIKGFIETLLGGALKDPEKSENFLKIMQEDADRLTRLINDLLELSKVESKENLPKAEPVRIENEMEKVLAALSTHLESKKMQVTNHLPNRSLSPALMHRDPLRQVLLNLLDNAIKFNGDGGKIIIDGQSQNGQVQISIEDTGMGIPQEYIPRIFERFFRVDKSRSSDIPGSGLGLAIAKHIVESYGGTLTCQSTPEKGSKFTFKLPISPSSSPV